MKRIRVKATFIEPILGTGNSNPEIHSEFIASKAPDAMSRAEEIDAIGVEAAEEKSTTIFARNKDGKPLLWNYQVKGYFKEACAMLQRMKGEKCAKESAKLKAYKKIIDGCIEPSGLDGLSREIPITMTRRQEIEILQRPLRASTAQGERIALSSSEMIGAGATIDFYIRVPDMYEAAVYEWLNYGKYHGMCQWRNAGYGRFTYRVENVETL